MANGRTLFLFWSLVSNVWLLARGQPPPPVYYANMTVDDSKILATSGDGLVSANFDWHLDSEEYPAWVNSSVLVLNLRDERIIYLAKQLAPGHLRIGGSEEDVAIYDIGQHEPCKPGFCMSTDRWKELVGFAQATGMRLVFGLNAMYGRKDKNSSWDSSNAEALIKYTTEQKLPVYGFELGNELQGKVSADKMAESYHDVRKLINQYWPDQSTRPILVGPDENPNAGYLKEFLPLVADAIDGVSYHLYPGYGLDKNLSQEMLSPSFLGKYRGQLKPLVDVVTATAPHAQGWIGETAAAWHSGQMHTTNGFISGLWYLGALGEAANLNQKALCRQTLIGGYYELINKTTKMPNPDYYTAVLWKRVMGVKMLSVSVGVPEKNQGSLQVYASCSPPSAEWQPGAVTVAFINLDEASDVVVGPLLIGKRNLLSEGWVEFQLTDGGNEYWRFTSQIRLNNVLLELTEEGELPDLSGKLVTDRSQLLIFPHAYGYFVFPKAGAAVCQ